MTYDFLALSRKQLMKYFEIERHECLSAGMSEANIFRLHFGELDEDGRGGDYRMWLDEHKVTRPDRKYAQGTPLSLESFVYESLWFEDKAASGALQLVEQTIDIEVIFNNLTKKQSDLLRALTFEDKTCTEYANEKGLNKSTISRNLERARTVIKKFYEKCN